MRLTVGAAAVPSGMRRRSAIRAVVTRPDPYLAIMDRDGIHHATIDIPPGEAFA